MPVSPLYGPDYFQRLLVETLKKQGGLLDNAMEAAFMAVPRHVFLPGETLERAYSDDAIAVKRDTDGTVLSSSSQPSMMALMLRQLRLRRGDNVLEIGTGTGYNAAIMQHIVGEDGLVTTIEVDGNLAEQAQANLQSIRLGAVVTVVNADGALGYAPRASYDRIIATAALWDVPAAWVKQLKPDGILVAPIWLEGMQVSAAFTQQPDGTLFSRNNISCGFISLRGMAAGPSVTRRVGSTGLYLSAHNIARIDTAMLQMLLSNDIEVSHFGRSMSMSEYWRGFLPFLTLNSPEGYSFAVFSILENQQVYGLQGNGFALIGRGTACFAPYAENGEAICFGSADAFIALNDLMEQWDQSGRPGSSNLRLKLLPKDASEPEAVGERLNSRIFTRQDHDLHIWLEV